MRKVVMAVVAAAISAFANAAAVDWSYTSQASEVGYKVYLYTSAVDATYETYDKLIEASFANGTVVSKKVGPTTTYKINSSPAVSENLGNTLYYVLVSGDTATTYTYGSSDISAYTYDPGNQETSPGSFTLTTASFVSNGTIGGSEPVVPEPTSGLLLLVGGAMLALRRKQK